MTCVCYYFTPSGNYVVCKYGMWINDKEFIKDIKIYNYEGKHRLFDRNKPADVWHIMR